MTFSDSVRSAASGAGAFATDASDSAVLDHVIRLLDAYRYVPLSVDIDNVGVARAVIAATGEGVGSGRHASTDEPVPAVAACRRALRRALAEDECDADKIPPHDASPGVDESTCRDAPADEVPSAPFDNVGALAAWIAWVWRTMRVIAPEALEMIRLRAAGHTHREIAEELGLGVRLVDRIIADARRAHCGEGGGT